MWGLIGLLAALAVSACSVSCAGWHEAGRSSGGGPQGAAGGAQGSEGLRADGGGTGAEAGAQPGEQPGQAETEGAGPPTDACSAYELDEADPLRRWMGAFAVERGGAVILMRGTSTPDQMEVEAVLEMRGMADYEATVCGQVVVVWVPGLECHGPEEELAARIESGTDLRHQSSSCFRLDQVRSRIAEECALGTLPGDRCP